MHNIWEYIDKSDSLSLKDENCFPAVMHCAMTSVSLEHTLGECNDLAVAQASLFKVIEDNSGEDFLDELWRGEKRGLNVKEFTQNVLELFTWAKLAIDHLNDDELITFVTQVQNCMKKAKEDNCE